MHKRDKLSWISDFIKLFISIKVSPASPTLQLTCDKWVQYRHKRRSFVVRWAEYTIIQGKYQFWNWQKIENFKIKRIINIFFSVGSCIFENFSVVFIIVLKVSSLQSFSIGWDGGNKHQKRQYWNSSIEAIMTLSNSLALVLVKLKLLHGLILFYRKIFIV